MDCFSQEEKSKPEVLYAFEETQQTKENFPEEENNMKQEMEPIYGNHEAIYLNEFEN